MNILFINTRAAKCSIYQSGKMFYKAVKDIDFYKIDYCEINDLDIFNLYSGKIVINGIEKPTYDCYIFNYHHVTMRHFENIKSENLKNLKGLKYTIILEMSKDNPVVRLDSDDFDGYIVLDPTMKYDNSKFYWFPRPLESININHDSKHSDIPIIGSFGYPTADKGFDTLVEAASREFEKAIVRLNIPVATYCSMDMYNQIVKTCTSVYAPNIILEITNNFLSDNELINWCYENTLNCFLYHRNSYTDFPGLAAATDQAIISGKPLAVSSDTTFRHIHRYIDPYPTRSLKDSINLSSKEVKRIQQDWNFDKCQIRLKEILN